MMSTDSVHSREAPRALIVGGSTGVGRGIAQGFVQAGYETTVLSRGRPNLAACRWLECDLRDSDSTQANLREITREPLSAVCFSPAFYGARRRPLVDTPVEEWEAQTDIMLHGLWFVLRACLPSLTTLTPGLFISVSSEVVYNLGPGRSGYAAVKSAASTLVRSAALEHTDGSLRVVEVLPHGMVDSPGIRSRRPREFDYTGYATPESFIPVASHLARSRGAEDDGARLAVKADGTWFEVNTHEDLPSQSRPS